PDETETGEGLTVASDSKLDRLGHSLLDWRCDSRAEHSARLPSHGAQLARKIKLISEKCSNWARGSLYRQERSGGQRSTHSDGQMVEVVSKEMRFSL
ncbi:hypothetical protein BaRGS_00020781, partial [Batillaria attramentaria]